MRKFLVGIILACSGIVGAQENYAQWSFYKPVVVNTKATGANVSTDQTAFPLLVRLGTADSAIFAQAGTGGTSLRFTKANGVTRLPHQIEHWDAALRKAAIWVLADTVKGNDSIASLRLYWGKVGAADSSNGAAVFDTANGFISVWHLGGDSTVPRSNSVAGAPAATPVNFPSGYVAPAGIIGRADTLRGGTGNTTTDHLSMSGSGYTKFSNFTNFSVSAWVYSTHTPAQTFTGARFIELTSNATGNDRFYFSHNVATNGGKGITMRWNTGTGTSNGIQGPSTGADTIEVGVWTHWMTTRSGTATPVLYKNGNVVATTAATSSTSAIPNTARDFAALGRSFSNTDPVFSGKLDEVILANASRSADWVKLAFESQKSTASAVTLGATQTQTIVPVALANLRYVPGNTATNDTLVFQTGVAKSALPSFDGGPADSIRIIGTSTLPAGVTFNASTGALSGTATATFAAASRTIRVYGKFGGKDSTSRVVVISSVSGPLANFKYNPDTTTYTTGLAVTNAPSWTGRAPTKFQVTAGALPAGLSLDTATGLITGAPTTAAAAANVTVRATNTAGPDTATRTLRLTVAAESYGTWAQRDTLWLNTQPGGAGTTTNVLNFPVLIRLDSAGGFSSVFTQSFGQGADLRFTKADNATRLPHQIEQWDSAGKRASVWVLVDTVLPNSRTQVVRMLWGKAGAQNASHGPSVFDTAKGFRAVFHFGEGAGIDTVNDATQYRFKGVPGRTATTYSFPEDTAGAVGRGRRFGVTSPATTVNSAGSYFTVPGSASPLNFPEGGPYTLSTWVIVRNAGTSKTFVSKSDRAYSLEFRNTGADWEFAEHNTTAGGWVVAGSPAATAGAGGASTIDVWTHITGVRGGGTSVLYVNGVAQTQALRTDANTNAHVTNVDLNIGRAPDNNTSTTPRYYWRGVLDEVRVANVARSADWAKLEYENQKANQTLVTTVQPPVGIASHVARTEGFGVTVKAHGRGLLFRLQGQDGLAGRATLTLLDMGGRAVWNGTFDKGTLAWDGRSTTGGDVAAGIYSARLTVLDKQGRAVQVLDRRVPYTR